MPGGASGDASGGRAALLHGALGAVALLALVLGLGHLARALPIEAWAARLGGLGPLAPALLLGGGALATAIGLPRQLVATFAGFAFGAAAGAALALAAATLGCALTMLAARRWLRGAARRRWPGAVARVEALARDDLFAKVVALRLQPLGTNLATNVAAGVLAVRPAPFLAASCVGYVPQTLAFALAGSGVRTGSGAETVLAVALFAVSLALGAVLVRRHRARARVARRTGAVQVD